MAILNENEAGVAGTPFPPVVLENFRLSIKSDCYRGVWNPLVFTNGVNFEEISGFCLAKGNPRNHQNLIPSGHILPLN